MQLVTLAGELSEEALRTLVAVMRDDEAAATARIKAAEAIITIGRPPEELTVHHVEEAEITDAELVRDLLGRGYSFRDLLDSPGEEPVN
jgi:hypothetical protein